MARRQVLSPPSAEPGRPHLSLSEVSSRLGVHYMTAYRYVRTGRLHAIKRDGEWLVAVRDVERLQRESRRAAAPRRSTASQHRRVAQLADRLVAGDEGGSWEIVQSMLSGGADPSDVYLDLFVPALCLIGERWASGEIDVADEHCATVVIQRLVGRTGPLFRRRGRTLGIVVIGAPEGELHALPTALAADLLRSHGFVAIDLGANVPTHSFVDCVRRLPRVIAVGIAVTTSGRSDAAGRLVKALREAEVSVPIILGGAGVDAADSVRHGADHWAHDAGRLVELVQEVT